MNKSVCLTAILAALTVTARAAAPEILDPLKVNLNTMRRLEENKRAQLNSIAQSPAFHQFTFTDAFESSQIQFRHHAVDDAAKNWKPAHYDHGSGLAVADVDGDSKLDLYFVNQLGRNELWRNTGGGKFENITDQAGVALENQISVAAAFADVDNDGRPDLFVTTVQMGNRLFRNLGAGKFEDIFAKSGVNYSGHSSGAVFFDYDNDGLLDLFVANVGNYTLSEKGAGGFYRAYPDAFKAHLEPARSEQSILYKNLGHGQFKDVSAEIGLTHRGWSGEATICDVDRDGFLDLYVLTMQGDDKFYRNNGGRRFVESTAAFFPKTPWGAMGVKFFDYNLDGRFDLYVTDMHSDMTESQTKAGKKEFSTKFEKAKSEPYCSVEWTDAFLQGASNNILGNAFYEAQPNGTFQEISARNGTETYWPWGPSVGDLNADGYEDIFVTAGMGYPFRYGINSVLLNESGRRFIDAEFALGIEPRRTGVQIEYFTLDCSGADQDHTLCYHKKGLVRVLGSTSSRSSVMLDIDDDGDLDIITNEMNDRPQVFVSDLAAKKIINFAQVKLVGTKSNRDALGARVALTAGDKTQHRMNDGKSGYLAQSAMPLYFGLGDATQISRIEVTWPSGKTQTLSEGLTPNKLITITEPQ
jgi:enediyne biosynthesis protein E4